MRNELEDVLIYLKKYDYSNIDFDDCSTKNMGWSYEINERSYTIYNVIRKNLGKFNNICTIVIKDKNCNVIDKSKWVKFTITCFDLHLSFDYQFFSKEHYKYMNSTPIMKKETVLKLKYLNFKDDELLLISLIIKELDIIRENFEKMRSKNG